MSELIDNIDRAALLRDVAYSSLFGNYPTIDGEYAYATDHKVAVRVPVGELDGSPRKREWPAETKAMLAAGCNGHSWVVDLGAIPDAPDVDEKPCEACEGYGEIACCECGQDVECDECEGNGDIEYDPAEGRYVAILGFPVDWRAIANLRVMGECEAWVAGPPRHLRFSRPGIEAVAVIKAMTDEERDTTKWAGEVVALRKAEARQ